MTPTASSVSLAATAVSERLGVQRPPGPGPSGKAGRLPYDPDRLWRSLP